ncbi:MAG TPA: L-lactate permease [Aliidongia sp.]|nr:L-lactate permease [Aliidongia sp.]
MLPVALGPLLLVILRVASRRMSILAAGCIGWVAALAAAAVLRGGTSAFPAWAAIESLKGACLAWQAVAVILAGLFFYRVLRRHEAHLFQADGPPEAVSRGRIWAVCFLLGPFAESATGFGVGAVVAMAALMRMGLKGPGAAVLALYSQMLVPWGGLAVGTIIGAHLAGESDMALGLASAVLTVPLLAGYLALYWVFAGRLTGPVPLVQRVEDTLWTALLAGALWLANSHVATELGGVVAPGALLVLHFVLSRRPDRTVLRQAITSALPFAILAALLIATRSIPPVTQVLRGTLVLAPFADQPSFPVFYNPSFWLMLVGLGVMATTGRLGELPARLRETWIGGSRGAGDDRVRRHGPGPGRRRCCPAGGRRPARWARARRTAGRPAVRRGRRLPDRQQCRLERHDDGGAGRPRRRAGRLDRRAAERHRQQFHPALADPRRHGGGADRRQQCRCRDLQARLADRDHVAGGSVDRGGGLDPAGRATSVTSGKAPPCPGPC